MARVYKQDRYTGNEWRIGEDTYERGSGRAKAIEALVSAGFTPSEAGSYLDIMYMDYQAQLAGRDRIWRSERV